MENNNHGHNLQRLIDIIGDIIIKSSLASFSRSMGTLLENGVPMVDGLKILNHASKIIKLDRLISDMITSLNKGKPLSTALTKDQIWPPMVLEMLAVGEQTAQMDRMFLHIAETCEKDLNAKVQTLVIFSKRVL